MTFQSFPNDFMKKNLQRYMPAERAIKFINDEGFYFRRIDSFEGDETEGLREYFGSRELEIIDIINSSYPKELGVEEEEARGWMLESMELDRGVCFVQSWFWDVSVSNYMWENYARVNVSNDCALFFVDRFKLGAYLDKIFPIGLDFKPVSYIDDKNKNREGVFTKHKDFSDEKEYRVAIYLEELVFYNNNILPEVRVSTRGAEGNVGGIDDAVKSLRNNGRVCENNFEHVDKCGFILKAPLKDLISKVLVPMEASDTFVSNLDESLERKGIDARCERIEIK